MIYQKYKPSSLLQQYVNCFYVMEFSQTGDKALEILAAPNGHNGIVFNYGEPGYSLQENERLEKLPTSFTAGQFVKSYSLQFKKNTGMIGIAFFPSGLHHFLEIPIHEFTGNRIDLKLIWPAEAAVLEEKIFLSRTHLERVQLLDEFLLNKLQKIRPKQNIVDIAVAEITLKNGILSINQLSEDLCISPRQLRRLFIEKVGITPKMCARIKRFNYVTNLSLNPYEKWLDMVHKGGYFDQAHFIRDFNDFSGKRPTDFVDYIRSFSLMLRN